MTTVIRDDAGRQLHKVTTRRKPPSARCGLCGWSETADPPGGRAEARALAIEHLNRPPDWPVFRLGQASRIGGRAINAGHTTVFVDDVLGEVVAWALADGLSDTQDAADAAHLVADTAVRLVYGYRLDAVDAVLAAGQLLREHQDRTGSQGDAAMVLAVSRGDLDLDGYELAWVGEARGYELREGQLIRLTVGAPAAVTASVATATAIQIGTTSTRDQRSRLVLASGGVHQPVPHAVMTDLVAGTADPRHAAHLLTLAPPAHAGLGNAAAMVIDPVATGLSVPGALV